MITAALAILVGFVILVWSADRFVEGAAATAKHLGMPSLLIGMVIVGFGTSAPEMVVSAIAAGQGSPALALGNAYGSNIVNTGLVLGFTAILVPLVIHSSIVRKELPMLVAFTLFSGWIIYDGSITRFEAIILLGGFFALMGWSVFSAMRGRGDALEAETEAELEEHDMPLKGALIWLVIGLALLIISSRILVWGAVDIAHALGVSDLIIGLTIVAIGTSLPELAATVIAARKGEDDIAVGNIVGSNMFNLLAVVGIAGVIHPMHTLDPLVISRDWAVMLTLTLMLFVMAYRFGREGKVSRFDGIILLIAYITYNAYLIYSLKAI